MIKEFCAENYTNIERAFAAGAMRVELCDNLAVGGTTPSIGVIRKTVQTVHTLGGTVMTMIRPRGGDFIYSWDEVEIMEQDIAAARESGSDGVVFGCIMSNRTLDQLSLKKLIACAKGLDITFHMAFDELEVARQLDAIDWLAKHGVKRILTHGGRKGTNISDNINHLKELIEYADKRIIILPGGGIDYENADTIIDELKITEVHGTKIVKI